MHAVEGLKVRTSVHGSRKVILTGRGEALKGGRVQLC